MPGAGVSSQSVNPRTGQRFGPVIADTTERELDAVLDAAERAGRQWSRVVATERATALRCAAEALDGEAAALVELADEETGLGPDRLRGELARTTFQLALFAELLESADHLQASFDGEVAGPPPAGHPALRRVRVAVGPVAVFGASNFPFAFSVPGGDTASGLAAGCPVVVKAHPAHPQTSSECGRLLRDALARAGAPPGVLSVVHGFDVGPRLVADRRIRAAAFTGSSAGGRALFDAAARRPDPIPFYGELGSVNPVVVTPAAAAAADSLVAGWLGSLTLGGGQFCTKPGLLLAPRDSAVAEQIRLQVAELTAPVLLHEGITRQLESGLRAVHDAPAARQLAAGRPAEGGGSRHQVVVMELPAESALARPDVLGTECFGPVGLLVQYGNVDQLLALIDAIGGCLVGTVHGNPEEPLVATCIDALARIAGRVVLNGWPTGVAVTSGQHHGGPWPASTNALHTSVGTAAIDRFTRPVAFQSVPESILPVALRSTATADAAADGPHQEPPVYGAVRPAVSQP